MDKTKVKKIAWISAAAALAALMVLITIACCIRVKDGFNTGASPFAVQISKNGRYSKDGKSVPNTDAYLQSGDDFDRLVKAYYSMTSFIAMRGIVEGKGIPQARLEGVATAQEIQSLAALPVSGTGDEKDTANKNRYLIRLVFDSKAPAQEAEIRVMKGTKDKPNIIKLDGEDGNEKEYKAGDKVSFKFTEIVLIIEHNRFIDSLTLYAFERDKEEGINNPEFVAYKIVVQANSIRLFNECTRLLP